MHICEVPLRLGLPKLDRNALQISAVLTGRRDFEAEQWHRLCLLRFSDSRYLSQSPSFPIDCQMMASGIQPIS